MPLPEDQPRVTLSVVVPVYAGSKFLEPLAEAVAQQREDWESADAPVHLCEFILVDDASRDGSAEVIDTLAEQYPWIIALHLSRNYGQHAATMAGVLHSAGDWVVTMDEDLQHPPDRIPDLLCVAVTNRGDIVYSKATEDVHESVLRDFTSRSFKGLMHWLTGNPGLRDFNSFRLIRGSIGRAAASVSAHDTYFDVCLSWFTQRVEVVRMELKDQRYIRSGKSGYSFGALLSHAWRMLFSSQIKLLRLGPLIGFATTMLTVLGMLYLAGLKLIFPEEIQVQGWTSLVLAISFFGGLSVFMLGLALQYTLTLVLKAHGKPTFFTVDRSADARIARWFESKKT